MNKSAKLAAAGLLLAASTAFAQEQSPPDTAASSPEGYTVLATLGSRYSGGQHVHRCGSDCDSPIIGIKEQTVTALLQSTKDGSLVNCTYEKISTEAGAEALLDEMDIHSFTGDEAGGLVAADALRPPAAGQHSGTIERGSCVPFETPIDVKTLRQNDDLFRYPRMGMGFGGETVSAGIGQTSLFYDKVRESRLITEYRQALATGQNPFPVKKIDNDPEWSYFSANGAACENTGDFSVAEEIERHNEDGTVMENVPLRGSCPLVP